ncbi:MAG: lytic transglycosylase domain-containing protein, partial [Chloroflexota bacterium]|nr:lytic transglycosylase domain-containing protein [Chloroflexota bacterium]
LGHFQLRAGEYALADAALTRAADVSMDNAAEALLQAGIARYARQDFGGALNAWQRGLHAGSPPSPLVESQLYFWQAKVLPSQSLAARDSLIQAALAAPESYHGLRAQELLAGSDLAIASAPASTWFGLNAEEVQERATWLASLGTNEERVGAELVAAPGIRRADALLEAGLPTEAGWEIDSVMQTYASAGDVAHLSALADWLMARDLPQLTLRVARLERELVGLHALPRAVQKQLYPAAWGDLAAEQSARHGLDPLLLLALVRQESSFDPRAQSNAQAMGLTQVIPTTARDIAARLGYGDFALRDLYKPGVSMEFGASHLASMLREFGGRAMPALAAYNAGAGNVSRWLQRFGDDPDLLVELAPFAETQTYLRTLYTSYRQYVRLYRG